MRGSNTIVTIYTSTTCAPCKVAKIRMKSAGVPFEEVQLDTDAAALAELKERRNLDTINTPSLEYGGKFYDMTTFRELLDTVASDRELAIA